MDASERSWVLLLPRRETWTSGPVMTDWLPPRHKGVYMVISQRAKYSIGLFLRRTCEIDLLCEIFHLLWKVIILLFLRVWRLLSYIFSSIQPWLQCGRCKTGQFYQNQTTFPHENKSKEWLFSVLDWLWTHFSESQLTPCNTLIAPALGPIVWSSGAHTDWSHWE